MSAKKISRLMLAGFAACSMLAVPPAFAKDSDEIVVTAPYSFHRNRDGSREVVVSRAVSARDLDLRRDGDVRILHERVEYAAALACEDADELMPLSATSDRECRREAIRDARPKVRALVAYARA